MMRILVLIDIDDGKPGLRFRSHDRRQAQHCTDCPQPPPLGEKKNAKEVEIFPIFLKIVSLPNLLQ